MPHLVEMREEYGSDELVVIGLTQSDEAGTRRFGVELGVTYTLLANATANFDAWGVSTIPQPYLVNPAGLVVADDLDDIAAILERELGP